MYRKFIASFLPLVFAACASLQGPTPTVSVPDKLKPRANESLAMIVSAKGVQIYECRAKRDQAACIKQIGLGRNRSIPNADRHSATRRFSGGVKPSERAEWPIHQVDLASDRRGQAAMLTPISNWNHTDPFLAGDLCRY